MFSIFHQMLISSETPDAEGTQHRKQLPKLNPEQLADLPVGEVSASSGVLELWHDCSKKVVQLTTKSVRASMPTDATRQYRKYISSWLLQLSSHTFYRMIVFILTVATLIAQVLPFIWRKRSPSLLMRQVVVLEYNLQRLIVTRYVFLSIWSHLCRSSTGWSGSCGRICPNTKRFNKVFSVLQPQR